MNNPVRVVTKVIEIAHWTCGAHGHKHRTENTARACIQKRDKTIDHELKLERTNNPAWKCWYSMIKRCTYAKNPHYKKYYIDKGIAVCDRWMNFDNFIADMGARPSLKHSIDSADGGMGYSPDNCRWATAQEQMDNRKDVPKLTFHEQTRTIRGWARELGVSDTLIRARLKCMSVEEALSRPARPYGVRR